ncbi:MAG: hypothetical protein JW828_11510 [Sedimentisphaerales bacterium]|nr:hypothetical protein [Sedimentisphaerales bacterium]
MKTKRFAIGFLCKLIVLGAAAFLGAYAWRHVSQNKEAKQLLWKNQQLSEAISNLTAETQIGYAKVIEQRVRDGRLFTRLKFVETHPDDPLKRVLEKEYEIEGDVVHFDALIVKFSGRLVQDGQERALYLWRRVYGEKITPEQGYPIEEPNAEPRRYAQIGKKLSLSDAEKFWKEIWELANDPQRLSNMGITAIHGNVVYQKVRPGLQYIFKIDNTGNVTPETVPDL